MGWMLTLRVVIATRGTAGAQASQRVMRAGARHVVIVVVSAAGAGAVIVDVVTGVPRFL